jgi:hypothetical protein
MVVHAMRNLDKTNRMADPVSPIKYQGAPHKGAGHVEMPDDL